MGEAAARRLDGDPQCNAGCCRARLAVGTVTRAACAGYSAHDRNPRSAPRWLGQWRYRRLALVGHRQRRSPRRHHPDAHRGRQYVSTTQRRSIGGTARDGNGLHTPRGRSAAQYPTGPRHPGRHLDLAPCRNRSRNGTDTRSTGPARQPRYAADASRRRATARQSVAQRQRRARVALRLFRPGYARCGNQLGAPRSLSTARVPLDRGWRA